MKAVIYRPSQTAMQSGRANATGWRLEFDPSVAREVEPLMGWTASADTRQQLRLNFESEGAAIAYCKRHAIAYQVREPRERRVRPKAYADNFSPANVRGPGTAPYEPG